MTTALRVSLTSALKRDAQMAEFAVLARNGPVACLGGSVGLDDLAVPVTPDRKSLFGPRGACLIDASGPLWVCDTGHHRLLGWERIPAQDGAPADWVIGQPNFEREGRNAKGGPSAVTLNVPTGISRCGDGLAVADAWNHRVLIWRELPHASNVPADIVLGQQDFSGGESNRGALAAAADSMFWPYGLHWDGSRLWVADTGNRRVLMWSGIPSENGQRADLVLGQKDFTCRDENGGGDPMASSMRWPHGVAIWSGRLCVADAGNNRIMVWNRIPTANNTFCDEVLGQDHMHLVDHNRALYWPDAAGLNMPYGITAAGPWLIVADTANSRLVAWNSRSATTGAQALALTGQRDFHAKGDNRWQAPSRDSLCWPYGVAHCDGIVAVADSGNNRVMLWNVSEDLLQ